MEQRFAAHAPELLSLQRMQAGLARPEGLDVVVVGAKVNWHELVPVLTVRLEILCHVYRPKRRKQHPYAPYEIPLKPAGRPSRCAMSFSRQSTKRPFFARTEVMLALNG